MSTSSALSNMKKERWPRGLREGHMMGWSTDVYVYRLNEDGTKGELIRQEHVAPEAPTRYNNRHPYQRRRKISHG